MKKRNLFIGLCAMLIVALLSGAAISAKSVTIVGTVHDDYQIVADNGQVYEIGDNEKGTEVTQLDGKRVKVTGTIEETDQEEKVIMVTSYEVIGE